MIVDGVKIARDIYVELKDKLEELDTHPCLTVFACVPNAETKKYLNLKKKRAMEVGVDVFLIELKKDSSTEEVVSAVLESAKKADGIIVQLPFPPHIDVDKVLEAVPKSLDVDAMHYSGEETEVLPPVVGAIDLIAKEYSIDFKDKQVAIVGHGKLVGKPAALWAKAQSAAGVAVIDKSTSNADSILKTADIIISGAGKSGLITPDKIKEGVAIFDAGTSEEGGQLRGDADPACASKCSLFTPVPGGIGPITIAVLLKNLVSLNLSK